MLTLNTMNFGIESKHAIGSEKRVANQGGLSAELVASLFEAEDEPEVAPERDVARQRELQKFHELPVTFKVQIGQTQRTLKEWLEIGLGSRISLEESWREPVHLFINDRRVGSGVIVLVGNRFGVRVTEWGEQKA